MLMKLTLGAYLKGARLALNIGQRELARSVGVSPAYINELEKGVRDKPSEKVVESLREHLGLKDSLLYDLVGFAKKEPPSDVLKYLVRNEAANSLVRMLSSINLKTEGIKELRKIIAEKQYKAVVIAAGLGSRLKSMTEDTPKCMLKINGKTILQHQIDAYNNCGISDISVVRGYKKEKINLSSIRYYENTDYKNNNILNSLFYAEEQINGNVIISYSDIIFSTQIVDRLLDSNADISIVVDVDWRGKYENRKDHPID